MCCSRYVLRSNLLNTAKVDPGRSNIIVRGNLSNFLLWILFTGMDFMLWSKCSPFIINLVGGFQYVQLLFLLLGRVLYFITLKRKEKSEITRRKTWFRRWKFCQPKLKFCDCISQQLVTKISSAHIMYNKYFHQMGRLCCSIDVLIIKTLISVLPRFRCKKMKRIKKVVRCFKATSQHASSPGRSASCR